MKEAIFLESLWVNQEVINSFVLNDNFITIKL